MARNQQRTDTCEIGRGGKELLHASTHHGARGSRENAATTSRLLLVWISKKKKKGRSSSSAATGNTKENLLERASAARVPVPALRRHHDDGHGADDHDQSRNRHDRGRRRSPVPPRQQGLLLGVAVVVAVFPVLAPLTAGFGRLLAAQEKPSVRVGGVVVAGAVGRPVVVVVMVMVVVITMVVVMVAAADIRVAVTRVVEAARVTARVLWNFSDQRTRLANLAGVGGAGRKRCLRRRRSRARQPSWFVGREACDGGGAATVTSFLSLVGPSLSLLHLQEKDTQGTCSAAGCKCRSSKRQRCIFGWGRTGLTSTTRRSNAS